LQMCTFTHLQLTFDSAVLPASFPDQKFTFLTPK
jgi:hypothetical protein